MFPPINYLTVGKRYVVRIPVMLDGLTAKTVPFKPDYQDQIATNLLAKRRRIEARLEQVRA